MTTTDPTRGRSIEQTATDYAAMMHSDPKVTDLFEDLDANTKRLANIEAARRRELGISDSPDPYTYPDSSNRDERRMSDEVGMSKSNQVMRGVLDEAAGIICGDRQDAYGLPEVNHQRTAEGWNWYIKHAGPTLDARDVCWLNEIQKISRDLHCRSRENCVDAVGYAANAAACAAAQLPVNGT